jgi:two-component system NtrC family sensor kinase
LGPGLDCMIENGDRLESPARTKRRNIVYLRCLLLLALGGLLIEAGAAKVGSIGLVLLIAHGATTVLLASAPLRVMRFLRFELLVGGVDGIFVAAALYLVGAGAEFLPVSCLMMALIVALGYNRAHMAAGGIVVCALHTWLILHDPAGPARQIAPHIALLGMIGTHFGYLAAGIHRFRHRAHVARLQHGELATLLEIIEVTGSSLDLERVTRTVIAKIAEIVPAARCSMVWVDDDDARSYVVAAHDDPRVSMLEIDLGKYPEIRKAIATQDLVLIRDIENDPTMREVRETLADLDLQSILVIPIVFDGNVLGSMCIRASRTRHQFTAHEVKYCAAVAQACNNVLKNALLHRRLQEESSRHRALGEKLSRIFDHSPELILTTDNDGRITEFNGGAEKLLGFSRVEILGRPSEMLFADDGGSGLVERTRATGQLVNHTCHLLSQQGRQVEVELNTAVLKDARGAVTGTVWLGRDVTELKATHTQLLQTKKLATIGEVISGVAHELNNPLCGVLGFSELVLLRESEPRLRRDLELIHDSAQRCQKIVKNLLSFARKNKPEREEHSLNEIVEKTLVMKKYQLRVNSIELVQELGLDLPSVNVDAHQIQQVLLNLVHNAQHAMMDARKDEGSRLTVRTLSVDGQVRVEIRDNGKGMSEQTLERIFDPFFTTKETGKGTGLGLSISYGIVQEHGGRVWADSREGEGTTFTIELPVGESEPGADATPPEDERETRNVPPGCRILVIDDEPVVLQLFINLLETHGYEVDTADSGWEALEMIGRSTYDVVVSDVRMPGMNGIDLFPRILERRPELEGRVIFVTGDLGERETARFLAEAEVHLLTKPIEINQVIELVDQVVSGTVPADQPAGARRNRETGP